MPDATRRPSPLPDPSAEADAVKVERPGASAAPAPDDQHATAALAVASGTRPSSPGVGSATTALAPGQLVAGRYRVVRFVAQGGMGEVYEADDLELRERVALKTVRPELARDARVIERFRREIQLARKVTHPNVSRIFDLGYHRAAPGEGPAEARQDVIFLTMELLVGETLAERLRRSGRMTTTEALPIVEQMGAALAAAHAAGIVHRDLKSANVILVGSQETSPRAVVTDFGLAHWAAGKSDSLTGAGGIVGTPEYMAPEQVEGGAVTVGTDVYALGVVLYEIVTGSLPFHGDSPLATAVQRLRQDPPPPRSLVPDLDPRWEAVILRCLERDPADRFASARDVVKALGGEAVMRGRRSRRWVAFAVAAALVLAAGGALLLSRAVRAPAGTGSPPNAARAAPARARRSVAVLGFKNLSGRPDAAWLSTAFAEMLTSELAAGEALRTIPGENVARMKLDLALADADSLAADTLGRIRAILGSDLVVLGSYVALGKESGGKVRLDLGLQDAVAGESIVRLSESGTEAEVFDLVSRAGARLRQRLGLPDTSAQAAKGARASLPADPEAARLYAEGLTRLRVFDALGGRDLLGKAAAISPNFPLVHSALAAAWLRLGYDGKAQAEARKAFDLSGTLPREERLVVEARFREATREWDKAIEGYRALFGFFPDNLEYGLRLAEAQQSAGKRKDALVTLEALRRLPPPERADPRIDLSEATTLLAEDPTRAQALAAQTAEKAMAQGARLLSARARHIEGFACRILRQPQKAREAFEEARRSYAQAGDRYGMALALNAIGTLRHEAGDIAGAQAAYEAVLATSREIGNRSKAALMLNNVGTVLFDQGDLAGARSRLEESLALARELGDRYAEGNALDNLAAVHLEQGRLAEAKGLLERELAIGREVAYKLFVAQALRGTARALLEVGDLSGARQRLDECLAISTEAGDRGSAAEARLALAALSIEDSRPGEAETAARAVADELRAQGRSQLEASAHVVVAQALLAQGKNADARQAVERARAIAGTSQNVLVRLAVALASGRVHAAASDAGDRALAAQELQAAIAQTQRLGLVALRFGTELALGELEVRSGRVDAGRARLAGLEKSATASGFGLVARKAGAARGRVSNLRLWLGGSPAAS